MEKLTDFELVCYFDNRNEKLNATSIALSRWTCLMTGRLDEANNGENVK